MPTKYDFLKDEFIVRKKVGSPALQWFHCRNQKLVGDVEEFAAHPGGSGIRKGSE